MVFVPTRKKIKCVHFCRTVSNAKIAKKNKMIINLEIEKMRTNN